jgi:hypothetical protein
MKKLLLSLFGLTLLVAGSAQAQRPAERQRPQNRPERGVDKRDSRPKAERREVTTDQILKRFDANGDGQLNRSELGKLVERINRRNNERKGSRTGKDREGRSRAGERQARRQGEQQNRQRGARQEGVQRPQRRGRDIDDGRRDRVRQALKRRFQENQKPRERGDRGRRG